MVDLHPFRPRLLDSLKSYDRSRLVHDIGAGISVGIVALPLAMAFAIASGVKPEQGIITAIVAGFLISALGGSSVQIGGPAGAFIVIVYGIVQRYGLTNLLIATALAGILLYVAWNMGEWHEFGRLKRFSNQYRTVLVGTFALTVVFDLTVAVQVGLILACLFFIYRMSTLFRVQPPAEATELPPGVQVFELFGSLFFGAVGKIESLPAQIKPDTRAVVLEMHRLISMDTSGLDALQQFHRALMGRGIALVLANVNEQPLSLIRRSGFEAVLGAEQIVPTVSAAFDDVTVEREGRLS